MNEKQNYSYFRFSLTDKDHLLNISFQQHV
jgi:hypothetical protein